MPTTSGARREHETSLQVRRDSVAGAMGGEAITPLVGEGFKAIANLLS
jgi:hypothetical protein